MFKVTRTMNKQDWDLIKANYRAVAGNINSTTWGSYTRGTVFFLGPNTTTQNVGAQVLVELIFLIELKGFYPLLSWFTYTGEHPSDSVSEATLRGRGLPAEDDVLQGNGLTLCSVQDESDFSLVFDFTLT